MVNEFRPRKRYNCTFDAMRHEIPVRIRVLRPLAGVTMRVQRGRGELLPPCEVSVGEIAFEFAISADVSGPRPNFLGGYAQGPKDARFVYVNSGTSAGQHLTCWARRAKLSLMSVTDEQIEQIVATPGARLETSMDGVGRDGGPTCATVQGLEWTVTQR